MFIRINRSVLLQAVQSVLKAVSSKTILPVLSGIKVMASSNGLFLTATDLELAVERQITTGIEVIREGAVVVTARYFYDIARNLPAEEVEIEVSPTFRTTIRAGESLYKVHGMDPEEFPALPHIRRENVLTIPSDLLKDMIRQTVFATSVEELRPTLTGVQMVVKNGRLTFGATDSHRMATREAVVDTARDLTLQHMIVPGKSMRELLRLLPDDDSLVDLFAAENQLLVHINQTNFYTRLLDGQYPDLSRMIPASCQTELFLNTKKLLGAVQRAALLGSREIRLRIEQDGMLVSSNSAKIGEVSEAIHDVQVHGEGLLIALQANYLLDAIRAINSETLSLRFSGNLSPVMIQEQGHANYVQLIVPVRFHS